MDSDRDDIPLAMAVRDRLLRAIGVVSAQTDSSPLEAMVMIRDRAQVQRVSLIEVADAAVNKRISFGLL